MLGHDRVRLQHMLDAAREVVGAVRERSPDDLERDHVWALGLIKCIEIIGEAASRVSKSEQRCYPKIPWARIVAMRNRLVHVYFDIDVEQVWKAVIEDIPPLIAELERILNEKSFGDSD